MLTQDIREKERQEISSPSALMPEEDQLLAPAGQRTIVTDFNSLLKGSVGQYSANVSSEMVEKQGNCKKHVSLIKYFPDNILLFVQFYKTIIL